MNESVFLTLEEVLRIHARSLAEHGGRDGVRDLGLVESALASAKNIFYYVYGDVFDIAAGYAFHLAESRHSLTEIKGRQLPPRWFFSCAMALMSVRQLGSFIWR